MGEANDSFAKEVDCHNGLYDQASGASSLEALTAIDKTIVMGALADPELLKAEDDAHHRAIGSIRTLIDDTAESQVARENNLRASGYSASASQPSTAATMAGSALCWIGRCRCGRQTYIQELHQHAGY